MSKLVGVVVFVFITLLPIASNAETAGEMLSACRPWSLAQMKDGNVEIPPGFGPAECWGSFIVLQRLTSTVLPGNKKTVFSVCAPREATRAQLVAIFVRYAEQNPKRHHEDFVFVALDALNDAFPCRGK
jgi:hypothetical protein